MRTQQICCQMVLTSSVTLSVIYPLKALFSSSLKWAVGIKWRNRSKAFDKLPDTASITIFLSLIITASSITERLNWLWESCHDWGIRLLATFDHKLPPYLKLGTSIHETPILLSFLWEFCTPPFKGSVMILFYFECAFKKTYLTQIWTEQKNKIESIKKNNKLIGSSSPSDESLPNSLSTLLAYTINIRIWWWILSHILFHSSLTSKLGRKIEQSIYYHPCSMGKEAEREKATTLPKIHSYW